MVIVTVREAVTLEAAGEWLCSAGPRLVER